MDLTVTKRYDFSDGLLPNRMKGRVGLIQKGLTEHTMKVHLSRTLSLKVRWKLTEKGFVANLGDQVNIAIPPRGGLRGAGWEPNNLGALDVLERTGGVDGKGDGRLFGHALAYGKNKGGVLNASFDYVFIRKGPSASRIGSEGIDRPQTSHVC